MQGLKLNLVSKRGYMRPLYQGRFIHIGESIKYYIHCIMWGLITHPPNFSGGLSTVEFKTWMRVYKSLFSIWYSDLSVPSYRCLFSRSPLIEEVSVILQEIIIHLLKCYIPTCLTVSCSFGMPRYHVQWYQVLSDCLSVTLLSIWKHWGQDKMADILQII